MKACVDCKHCRKEQIPGRPAIHYTCKITGAVHTDPVTGHTHSDERSCSYERSCAAGAGCGEQARFFEPTLGARLIHLFTGEDF